MNKHHLKINPEHYYNVKDGTKTFEIRKMIEVFKRRLGYFILLAKKRRC